MATKTYNGRIFTTGDTIYFAKFGTRIDSGYASNSGKYGTCHASISSLYAASYAFPIYITGKVTTPSSGTFTGCTVKPSDCSKGYQVKVTYSHNSGSGTASQTGYVGKSLTGTSSRSGYTFAGWYTAASGGSKVTTIPKDATTYYAHWTANKYTVTLNNQSATTAGTTSVSATYGSAMPAITKPTKTGYTFGGYYTSTGGSGTQYYTAAGASARSYDYAGARTLYAKWSPITYYVKFDGNGATSGTMSNETFSYGTAKALTANAFTRTYYKFLGWSTNQSATAATYNNQQSVNNLTATNGNTVTLYAIWEQEYIKPTIIINSCTRYSQDDQTLEYIPSDNGEYLHLNFECSANTVFGENYISQVVVERKLRNEPDSAYETIFASSGGNLGQTYIFNNTITDPIFSTENTYDIKISVGDHRGDNLTLPFPHNTAKNFLSVAFFTMDFSGGRPARYSAISEPDPLADPSTSEWYELVNEEYILSEDTEVNSEKTYYALTQTYVPGGYGIGIGAPAPVEGLLIGLNTTFYGNVTMRPLAGIIQMYSAPVTQTIDSDTGRAITTNIPMGWLLCDGSILNIADYPILGGLLLNTYGGDGIDTFALPDFRGRVGVGVGNGTATGHTNHTLGQKGGNENAIIVSHSHKIGADDGSRQFVTRTNNSAGIGESRAASTTSGGFYAPSINSADNWWGTENTQSATGGVSGTGANMPPYIGINFIIATGELT